MKNLERLTSDIHHNIELTYGKNSICEYLMYGMTDFKKIYGMCAFCCKNCERDIPMNKFNCDKYLLYGKKK